MLIKNKWLTLLGAGIGQMMSLLSEECEILHQQERSLFVAVRPLYTDCHHCWEECKDKGELINRGGFRAYLVKK